MHILSFTAKCIHVAVNAPLNMRLSRCAHPLCMRDIHTRNAIRNARACKEVGGREGGMSRVWPTLSFMTATVIDGADPDCGEASCWTETGSGGDQEVTVRNDAHSTVFCLILSQAVSKDCWIWF